MQHQSAAIVTNGLTTLPDAIRMLAERDLETRKALQDAAEKRKRQSKDLQGIGRPGLVLTPGIEFILKAYKPELYQDDQHLQAREWLKFMAHSDSEILRLNNKL